MNTEAQPLTIQLADYQAPAYGISSTDLTFQINEGETLVENRMAIDRRQADVPLVLDGQGLQLESVAIDGREISSNQYQQDDQSLTLFDLPDRCEVTVVTRIIPEQNTALEGLYKSSGMYCTQCEAEGFRKITYYQDRPDVLSVFSTTIVASSDYPVLLSNGNLIARQELADGRCSVTWEDPFPKPSYLFALVAGDLALLEDTFVTMSGRQVTLRIYSESHNIGQCDYAMGVLKRSMRWDEQAYGREYDLDIYMIVAVDDFNMGAMENKGLNVFNTSCVLAGPDTATDQSYLRVEAVVAHEYFHNWSGNRVTCRDWFQLSLKEGFTVFRDAQFSSDMNSPTVKRIEDVSQLRAVQFAEASGPLAHPVRPASYIEISNFYTPTVYEKGAEVVRMVHTILGADAFRKGSDLYFDRHDGEAVTTEHFLAAMSEASGRDLSLFQRWYDQAGTPLLNVASSYADGTLELAIAQSCPATPGQPRKSPFHIPVALGLIDQQGDSLNAAALTVSSEAEVEVREDTLLVHLRDEQTRIRVTDLTGEPQISFLRGFSAPVKVVFERPASSLGFLATHDSDGFAGWDALQTLLVGEIGLLSAGPSELSVTAEVRMLFENLLAQGLDAGERSPEENFLLAAKLSVPSENYLFEQVDTVDVDGLCGARDRLLDFIAVEFADQWQRLFDLNSSESPYSPDSLDMSRRALKNMALGYLSRSYLSRSRDRSVFAELLDDRYRHSDNLTDRRAILIAALHANPEGSATAELLRDFYERWHGQALVVNQWFSVQAGSVHCDVGKLRQLVAHPDFTLKNPNKVRSVLSIFAAFNQRNFHAMDGSGYGFIGERVIELNGINPQMAAALAKPLTRWQRYSGERGQLMQATLVQIAEQPGLSSDVFEIVSKSLV